MEGPLWKFSSHSPYGQRFESVHPIVFQLWMEASSFGHLSGIPLQSSFGHLSGIPLQRLLERGEL